MATATKVNTTNLSYEDIKKVALNGEMLSQKVQLSNVDVDENGQLYVNGTRMQTDDGVAKQLYDILGVPQRFATTFGKLTDEQTKKTLIQLVKQALMLKNAKKQFITIIGNPRTQVITNLLPGDKDYISHKFGFELLERIMNTYPNFRINDFELDNKGNFNIQLLTKDAIIPVYNGSNLILGEDFNPGINFRKHFLKGAQTDFFTNRKVCDNGLIIQNVERQLNIDNLTDKSLEQYFQGLLQYEKDGFVPPNYGNEINRAIHTNVSFAELLEARKIMLRNSKLTDDELKNYLPEFSSEVHKLASKGVEYSQCTDRQLQNYPVNHKVWDIVNRVTNFGSHDYGFSANNSQIQRQAGKFLMKDTFDSENVIVFKN